MADTCKSPVIHLGLPRMASVGLLNQRNLVALLAFACLFAPLQPVIATKRPGRRVWWPVGRNHGGGDGASPTRALFLLFFIPLLLDLIDFSLPQNTVNIPDVLEYYFGCIYWGIPIVLLNKTMWIDLSAFWRSFGWGKLG